MSDNDYGAPSRQEWLGAEGRSHYIPGWYVRHQNLDAEVTHNGKPQGMKIRDVMVHRRWALDENGCTLEQRDFEDQHTRYMLGFKNSEFFDPRNEPTPAVLAFVRAKRDEKGNLVDFSFNDDGAVIKEEKFTQEGVVAPEWLAKNQETSDKLLRLEQLNELLADGTIDSDTFVRKSGVLLGHEIPILNSSPAASDAKPAAKTGRPKGSTPKTEEQLQAARDRMAKARAVAAERRSTVPTGYVGEKAPE